MMHQILTASFLTAFLSAAVRMAVPLAYAGLGETISEKCGILNIGMEGVMLSGAFFSFAGTFFSGSILVFYKKTNTGLSFAAIGESPRAADSAGIPVYRYQYISMVLNGILGGIGGAYLVLVQVGNFSENMTSGRGYIALAAVILGRYLPFGMLGAAFLFGAANALQIRLQAVGVPLPSQALSMLPYLITLAALLGSAHKNHGPESLGKPYVRGA